MCKITYIFLSQLIVYFKLISKAKLNLPFSQAVSKYTKSGEKVGDKAADETIRVYPNALQSYTLDEKNHLLQQDEAIRADQRLSEEGRKWCLNVLPPEDLISISFRCFKLLKTLLWISWLVSCIGGLTPSSGKVHTQLKVSEGEEEMGSKEGGYDCIKDK